MQERPHWWSPEEHPGQSPRRDWDEPRDQAYGREREHDTWRDERDEDDYDNDVHRDWTERTGDEIKSWFGNERAERRRDLDHVHEREQRRREEAPYRGVGPQAYHGEDDWLRDQVCSRLADDPHLNASDIIVRVLDNEAILDGFVSSKRDARRAYDIAENVPGIIRVRERLSPHRRRRRWTS